MPAGTELTTVAAVHEEGSYRFSARGPSGVEEFLLVPCEDGVRAWQNRCPHESQRFDTGRGAPIREGEIVCPRHGSLFDACEGDCDNGPAAGTTLPGIEVTVADGVVYLTDDDYAVESDDDGDDGDGPSSTSHIGF